VRFLRVLVVAALPTFAACGDAADTPHDVAPNAPTEPGWTRLANGLRTSVRRIDDAKDVAVLVQFGVGSDHDPEGKSGLSHLTEHLFVTCAAGETPARTADAWLAKYASRCMALTLDRVTTLYTVVKPDALETELRDVAARLSDLRIEASDLDRERPRVIEQIGESSRLDARAVARRLALRRLFPRTARDTGAGDAGEVSRLTLDDVRAWARRFYRAADARLVVVGAVDESAATALVERMFSALPAGERPPPIEHGASQPGVVEIDADGPTGPNTEPAQAVCIAYPFEGAREEDQAAASLFLWRAMDQSRQRDVFQVHDPDVALVAAWVAGDGRILGDEPYQAVVHGMDAIVANVAEPPTQFDFPTLHDMTNADPTPDDAAFPEKFAVRSVSPTRLGFDARRIHELAASLAADDMKRFVAKWLAPERRVVAVVHGRQVVNSDVKRPQEDGPEIRVALQWDATRRMTVGEVGGRIVDDDDKLTTAIVREETVLAGRGARGAHVTFDYDPRVPWKSVAAIIDAVTKEGIRTVRFAPRRK